MKTSLKKNFYKIRFLLIVLGTLIMFHAFYFSDKQASIETIYQDKNEPMMYLCMCFSFGISILIHYIIGFFNKDMIKNITTT